MKQTYEVRSHFPPEGRTKRANSENRAGRGYPNWKKDRFKYENAFPRSVKDVRTIVRTALAEQRALGVRE